MCTETSFFLFWLKKLGFFACSSLNCYYASYFFSMCSLLLYNIGQSSYLHVKPNALEVLFLSIAYKIGKVDFSQGVQFYVPILTFLFESFGLFCLFFLRLRFSSTVISRK